MITATDIFLVFGGAIGLFALIAVFGALQQKKMMADDYTPPSREKQILAIRKTGIVVGIIFIGGACYLQFNQHMDGILNLAIGVHGFGALAGAAFASRRIYAISIILVGLLIFYFGLTGYIVLLFDALATVGGGLSLLLAKRIDLCD